MKPDFIAGSDFHATSERPKYRCDDYAKTFIKKFDWICKYTKKNSGVLVIAGDFFDHTNVPYEITRQIILKIRRSGIKVLCVAGQHDLKYHVNNLKDTPLGTLKSAGVVSVLSNNRIKKIKGISFVGSGWEEEPKKKADVILTHRMVVEKDPLWPGQTDYITAERLLKKYKWAKCIVSGDNHRPHCIIKNKRIQVNSGSIMRSTKFQIEHVPGIWEIYLKKGIAKRIDIPHEEASLCFDFKRMESDEERKQQKEEAHEKVEKNMKKFLDSIPKNQMDKPNFKEILHSVEKATKPNRRVKQIIKDIMGDIG